MTLPLEVFILGAALLTLISVLASKVSDRLAVPALVFFLLIGIVAGSEGLGGIKFDNYLLAKSVGIIALIFIIFSGGLDTEWRTVRPLLLPGILLSTVGVFITAVVVGLGATMILQFTLLEGLLLGAIVSSTDAAAVFSILRSKKISLRGKLKPLLELESGSNDPMAIFLTLSVLGVLAGSGLALSDMAAGFAINMGVGALLGYVMGRVTLLAVNRVRLEYEGLYPVLTISLILLTYSVTTLLKGNGFLAVYILGLCMSRRGFSHQRTLVRFHEGIAWLMQIIMFLTLGLLVFPSEIIPVIGSGLLITGILIIIARPVSVFLCLAPFGMPLAEKGMVSWVGLRAAVPIILATFPLFAGIEQSHTIFNIVFFVVLTSVLLQGTSIPFVAKLLNVQAPFDPKTRFPIELDHRQGIDASLEDIIVPYGSSSTGRPIAELNIPDKALIVLIARNEKFIVPSGATVIEEGDVLQVLANEEDLKTLIQIVTA